MAFVSGSESVVVDKTAAVAVAARAKRVVPEGVDGEAGEPADEGIGDAPERGEDNQDDADAAEYGAFLEEAKELEKERELDECGRGEVGGVHEVKCVQEAGEFGQMDVEEMLAQAILRSYSE